MVMGYNMKLIYVLALVAFGFGCGEVSLLSGERSVGLSKRVNGGGPVIIYDVLAKPLPEIPLPNDQATRLDPTSITGRRLNVSKNAPTAYERRARTEFNSLDGFGTYSPITVSFDARLDIPDLQARHLDTDFTNDAIYVLNVSPDCSRFGEEVGLDMGRGRFPITLFKRERMQLDPDAPDGFTTHGGNLLFDFDNQGFLNNLMYSELNEPDTNGDGVLQVAEDIDQDGVRDRANFIDPSACDSNTPFACAETCSDNTCFQACLTEHDRCVADNLVNFYEYETNTLVLRPIWPLEQKCTYAVVLTKRLTDEDDRPVESPFPGVNPRNQTKALKPLAELLPKYDLGLSDIAFAWTFTTGDMTGDIEAIRAGLYGSGPFSQLQTEFPTETSMTLWPLNDLSELEYSGTMIDGACGGGAVSLYWNIGMDEWEANLCALEADLSGMSGIFGGTFDAPYLLNDKDGHATEAYPADNDEVWQIDPHNGTIEYGRTKVSFWCSLPIEADDCTSGNPENRPFCKPFPTILYAHGYGGSRAEIASHMGRHNSMGYAICALDGPGHGGNALILNPEAAATFSAGIGFFEQYYSTPLIGLLTRGRDRDLNNDGIPDPGGDMWTSDLFHTRDMVRQAAVEYIQFIRILRSFGQTSNLGDFTGDGKTDMGGRDGTIGMWGISLGGVISGVMAGAEPGLDSVSPNAGGAGLSDIASRASQSGVPEAVLLPIVGPLIAGCLPVDEHQRPVAAGMATDADCLGVGLPAGDGGTMTFGFMANDVARLRKVKIGQVSGVQPGDRVVIQNLINEEHVTGWVNDRGRIRLGIPADAIDAVSRRSMLGFEDGSAEPRRAEDPTRFGDTLTITVYEGDTQTVRGSVDTWQTDTTFQGTTYVEGTPLVALYEGYGLPRNSPRFRRFLGLAQSGISKADPAIWGVHTFMEPLQFPYDPNGRTEGGETKVLMMPTAGDKNVPASAGIAMGRVSGVLGSWKHDSSISKEYGWREIFKPDPRYGKSPDEYLIDVYAIEGDGRLQRYRDNPNNPNVIFDVENVSDGRAMFSCGDSDWSGRNGENKCPAAVKGSGPDCADDTECDADGARCVKGRCEVFFPIPRPENGGLRLNWAHPDGRFNAFRLPLMRPAGQHGIYNAQSFRDFDTDAYMVNFTIRFLGTRGEKVEHVDGCDCSASALPNITVDGRDMNPALFLRRNDQIDQSCQTTDLKVCSAECAAIWGIRTPAESACLMPDQDSL